jgi:hypothetical protein
LLFFLLFSFFFDRITITFFLKSASRIQKNCTGKKLGLGQICWLNSAEFTWVKKRCFFATPIEEA